ncbi:hypothetical protein BDM02DRAFT_3109282 [Thelephora ganbajun]|uniref:Uncharacterized protein n=1 Tax=Thelephora ganbajun TaxID=370292 RepID=A0ACB6ZRP1_THEGA|nr:hypothetical protein BDM02DRAFT_3109282 [Thelephora ganbajun]
MDIRRRRVPVTEFRAAHDPTERTGSWQSPQKAIYIRLDSCVHGVALGTVTQWR